MMDQPLALLGGPPIRVKPFARWPIAGEEERRLLLEAFDSGTWGFGGPKEAEFANEFAAFCGAREAFCVANGTVSLEIALRALGIGPGDEVIVPALTWHATAWAVVQVGATPVFADVTERDWCLDPAEVRAKRTSRTRAIIPVHLYHQVAEMDELCPIARQHSLLMVEDCAHAHGSRWGANSVGTLGQIGSFSFQSSKGMTSGEGGALITNDEDLAHRIYSMKNCGRPWKEGRFGFGGNYRITEFQAALLLPQLHRLESQLSRKRENLSRFRKQIEAIPGVSIPLAKPQVTRQGLYGVGIRIQPEAFAGVPAAALIAAFQAEGIPVQAPYPVVYRSPLWTSGAKLIKFESGAKPETRLGLNSICPVAERISAAEGLVILHQVFLGVPGDMDDLAAAFAKVQRQASTLCAYGLQLKIRGAARTLFRTLKTLKRG